MNQALKDLGDHIAQALPNDVVSTDVKLDELMVTARAAAVVRVLTFLRDDANASSSC